MTMPITSFAKKLHGRSLKERFETNTHLQTRNFVIAATYFADFVFFVHDSLFTIYLSK